MFTTKQLLNNPYFQARPPRSIARDSGVEFGEMTLDTKIFKIKKEEKIRLIKILQYLTLDEKKNLFKEVHQRILNSTNKILAKDNPPGKPLTKLPPKLQSEIQAKAFYMGRNFMIEHYKNEMFKERRKQNINLVKV